MQPNFSMVRLKQNLMSHWCDQPFERKKVSTTLKVSMWFNYRHTLGPYRGLNQSEIVKGGPPPLIACGPDIPVCVCMFDVCAAAVRQRERGVIDICAVLPT